MGWDSEAALKAQGLDASDIDANRSGRVTEAQIARQRAVRSRGALGVWGMASIGLVGVGVGAYSLHATDGGWAGPIAFGAIMALFLIGMPLGIYYAFRFADPAKVGACKVTRLEGATVGAFLPSVNFGGIYAISLNGQRYSGFATLLRRAQFGDRVNAFVVPEHKIVVAIEPID